VREEGATANVDQGSLLSFVAGVTKQRREDVLDSTLLAQLAASAAFEIQEKLAQKIVEYIDDLELA
jgi:hypothetical protein